MGPGSLARYYYNGSGQRIKKVAGGVDLVYTYDQWGNLICEKDTSNFWRSDYVYIDGWPVAKIDKFAQSEPDKGGGGSGGLVFRKPYYYHNDHLGTPQALTHSGKLIWWKAHYYPFGTLYDETVVIDNNLRFPGQYADEETSLYYNWHRYYFPDLGRYYAADPIGLVAGVNLYAYAYNNPTNLIDPSGLKVWTCKETKKPIEEAGRQDLAQGARNHYGRGIYDFKVNQPNDMFVVGHDTLQADQFGNFLAAYVGYKTGLNYGIRGARIIGVEHFPLGAITSAFSNAYMGYWVVRLGGLFFDFKDALSGKGNFDWDRDSIEMIDAGMKLAILEAMGLTVIRCPCP